MKRLLISAAAVAALGFAAPAFAQTATGTINVTGTVTTQCSVVVGGSGNSFAGTISLGTLNAADGTLSALLSGSTSGAAAGSQAFQISCNGSDASVSLNASELSTGTGTAPTGYSRNINYTAEFDGSLAAGGIKAVTYNTTGLPGPTTSTLGGRLANAPGNVVVKVYGLSAENGATSLLEAGSYASTINVSITPITPPEPSLQHQLGYGFGRQV